MSHLLNLYVNDLREVFKNRFLLITIKNTRKYAKGMTFTMYDSFIYIYIQSFIYTFIYNHEAKINYSNKLSASSLSSLPYSSSSEYLSSFSMLPSTFH